MTQMELNLTASRAARDEGMAKVADNAGAEFITRALDVIANLEHGSTCTGESVRFACEQQGIRPHSPHAVGAMINIAIRRKMILPTGQYTQMRSTTSHARATQIYLVP